MAPSVTTDSVTGITKNSAILIGNVTNDGGAAVTEKGFCWSTNPTPTFTDNVKTANTTGTGSFSDTLTGLTSNTTYYVRAYAINSADTSYGLEKSFKTLDLTRETIYEENMGNASTTTAIDTNVFQNTTVAYSGINADVRATYASTTAAYASASGGANIFMSSTTEGEFTLGPINTEDYSDIELSFGFRKASSGQMTDIKVTYSTNGTDWTAVAITKWEKEGTSGHISTISEAGGWYYLTCAANSNTIPSDNTLYIKFSKTSTGNGEIRFDDVKLTGKK